MQEPFAYHTSKDAADHTSKDAADHTSNQDAADHISNQDAVDHASITQEPSEADDHTSTYIKFVSQSGHKEVSISKQ